MTDGQLPAAAVSRPSHIPVAGAAAPDHAARRQPTQLGSLLAHGRHRQVRVTRSASPGRRRPGAAPSYSLISPPTTDGARFAAGRDPRQG